MFALKPRANAPLLPRVERPFRDLEGIPGLFNRLFSAWPVMDWPLAEMAEWEPRWDTTIEEKDAEYVLRAELPGFEPAEIKVEVTGEMLTIEAEHKEAAEKKEAKAERYDHVKRSFTLPGVEPDKVEATYRNGILTVKVPRKPELVGRRVEVKT